MIKTKEAAFINIDDNLELSIQKAKKIYLGGEVLIYPTDTIYGFGANPFNEEAVQKINEIKGREIGKMYILLINDIKIHDICALPSSCSKLIKFINN